MQQLMAGRKDLTITILGDPNINAAAPHTPEWQRLQTCMQQWQLQQHVQEFTTDFRTIIDHIWTDAATS